MKTNKNRIKLLPVSDFMGIVFKNVSGKAECFATDWFNTDVEPNDSDVMILAKALMFSILEDNINCEHSLSLIGANVTDVDGVCIREYYVSFYIGTVAIIPGRIIHQIDLNSGNVTKDAMYACNILVNYARRYSIVGMTDSSVAVIDLLIVDKFGRHVVMTSKGWDGYLYRSDLIKHFDSDNEIINEAADIIRDLYSGILNHTELVGGLAVVGHYLEQEVNVYQVVYVEYSNEQQNNRKFKSRFVLDLHNNEIDHKIINIMEANRTYKIKNLESETFILNKKLK